MKNMTTEMRLLASERHKISFSVEEMTHILDGGKEETEIRRKVERVISDDPILKHNSLHHMTREERFTEAVRRTVYFYKILCPHEGWMPMGPEMKYFPRAIKESALVIHAAAFIPSIMSFGSDEQISKWLPLALDLSIVGTYAQTELGHGTFLRGLETVAMFDRATQEFVINCPNISSMKWWPGDLGKSANHVLLMAELMVDGRKYGMHAFIVQIRDLTTHQPLPGVTVGDIGTKLAFESIDNGYLYLKNFRIPRENLLSKLAVVDPDGKYRKKKKASDRLMYGSMVNLRVSLLGTEAVMPLAKACTIAVRYSAVRRQGLLDPKKDEVPVLDYVAQQEKLLPQVAKAFLCSFASQQLIKMYQAFLKSASSGDISQLPELHALSAGMKASVSEQCVAGAESLRRACGGHGYSYGSGLPFIVNRMLAACTYEGENTVMYLQCARYLVKCIQQTQKTRLSGSVAYLNEVSNDLCSASSPKDFLHLNVLKECFQKRSCMVVKQAADKIQHHIRDGMPVYDAWNMSAPLLIIAAKAHIIQYIVTTSADFITFLPCSAAVKRILTELCALYALNYLNNNSGDFVKGGFLNVPQCNAAQDAELNLLTQLRPNAVGIVDAFDFTDDTLQSCIGSYDGNVYERLFEWAKQAPMNRKEVHEDSYQYYKQYLHKGRDVLEGNPKSKL